MNFKRFTSHLQDCGWECGCARNQWYVSINKPQNIGVAEVSVKFQCCKTSNISIYHYLSDCFDTECDMDGEDSTVLVDEFYNTDCDVTDDDKEVIEELDQVSISLTSIALSIFKD